MRRGRFPDGNQVILSTDEVITASVTSTEAAARTSPEPFHAIYAHVMSYGDSSIRSSHRCSDRKIYMPCYSSLQH